MSSGEMYRETRLRITELARSLSAEELAVKLPACPEWNTRDVIGHLTGLLADLEVGNREGAGTPAWTAAQVDAYRVLTLDVVLAEWEALAAKPEAAFEETLGPVAPRILSDIYTHEQDVRGALGRPGHRDAAALAPSLDLNLELLGERISDSGLPALRVRTADGGEWVFGDGESAATVTAPSRWELYRALMSRRTRAQVAGLAWEGADAGPYLDLFFRLPEPEQDIVE